MFRLLPLLILLLLTIHAAPAQEGRVHYPLPDSFVNCLRSASVAGDTLLNWLNTLTGDSLVGAYTDPLSVNIDKDPDHEILALLGGSANYTHLGVIDRQEGQWVMIFLTPVSHHYESLSVQVMNCPAPERLFYLKLLEQRGSGIFYDSWYGFRLIDGVVYPCLRVQNKAQIYGWGLFLNQETHSKFTCDNDGIYVDCYYHFFPGAVFPNDLDWEGHPDMSFVRGKGSYRLDWNPISNSYQPVFDDKSLTETQWRATEEFGADSLFVAGFGDQLDALEAEASARMKRIVRAYRAEVTARGTAEAPSGGLVEQGQTASGLRFYGTAADKQKPRRKRSFKPSD
ncbi:MAG: hypothetical protein EAZ89_05785 [Bacteroidetes bacterium]|jgi:hypothetical protein|nr:MAG: hypothetical protein EAZ89_05785 [Bacteroidota bacterium]